MGFLFAFWRRFFGGYDSKFDFLEKRGVQMILCIISVFVWEFFKQGKPWYISLIVSVLIYIFWCRGHWYYYMCGEEDDSYIDEQLAKGRKPAMWWLVRPICKMLGFTDDRSRQYCFVGLMIRYFLYSLPVTYFVGWQFAVCGFCIPFVYNAMFWVELPKNRLCSSPTNWAEFFNGLIIGWGLW